MEAFGIIKLIFGTTFLGLMMLTGIYNDESFYKVILAVIMTLGLLYGIGQLPYAFLIFIILGITMYTYVQTSSIEDTLFNTLLVFTVCILLGLFGDTDFFKPFKNFKLKEGFYFSPNARRLVSHSMTALQCQNVCANDKHCKFSYYGRNMERGGRGQCWNTHGSDSNQRPYGGKNQGGITWRNKKYTPKPPPKPLEKFRHGMFISIRNRRGNWLCARPNGQIILVPHRRGWETFQVLRHPDRKNWLLKSYHGRYLHFAPSWRWYKVSFIKNGRPVKEWSWERINFKKKGNGWGIYNPYHRKYLNNLSNNGLGMPWLGGDELVRIYEVPTTWGRGSRENRDKEIR